MTSRESRMKVFSAIAMIESADGPWMGVRTAVMSIWEMCRMSQRFAMQRHDMRRGQWHYLSLASFMAYGVEHPSSRKRIPMNVDELVVKWIPIIRGLSVGHTKAEIDRCEFESETYLAPLLTAPVKQLREFFAKLCEALRTDPTIPLFVHSTFDAWHEVVVKTAPDEAVKELKTALATEIAELVETDVQPDIKAAIVGALQWRSGESLIQVRDAVKNGAKPRLRGKESCLFLEVPTATGAVSVML